MHDFVIGEDNRLYLAVFDQSKSNAAIFWISANPEVCTGVAEPQCTVAGNGAAIDSVINKERDVSPERILNEKGSNPPHSDEDTGSAERQGSVADNDGAINSIETEQGVPKSQKHTIDKNKQNAHSISDSC